MSPKMSPGPSRGSRQNPRTTAELDFPVEARRIELPNLLHAMRPAGVCGGPHTSF